FTQSRRPPVAPRFPYTTLFRSALAVAVSDLAAMGARPLGFTLALTLPTADEAWLSAFSDGLAQCAVDHRISLIGGDTTRGPLNIDRKSTRLNSSHVKISYAVFC